MQALLTPTRVLRLVNRAAEAALRVERRVDPLYRDQFDRILRDPLFDLAQAFVNLGLPRDSGSSLAEEQPLPDEQLHAAAVIELMTTFLRRTYPLGKAQRAGNTKTYGVVRGEFRVLANLPSKLRHGVFARPHTFPAWVRFAGPGPLAPPDLDDNGVLSFAIKLMGVPGAKLIDDERFTQDFTGISAPTFTTPDVRANVQLQRRIGAGIPLFYFLDPRDSHVLDLIMQGLYSRTQTSPLEAPYYSCVPYLLGEGQAMQYSLRPRATHRTRVPRFPSDDYLREAMAATLGEREVTFDFFVQLQTDPDRMPIENASVRWPEQLSPHVWVAELRLPAQMFGSPAQLAFADNLSFNPWHALAEHRPLGNQNRARKAIYMELSRVRQQMNAAARIEPTGDETFPPRAGSKAPRDAAGDGHVRQRAQPRRPKSARRP
jgi:hypothetical protein